MNSRILEDIVELCRVLAEQENLKVTVKQSAKGAIYAGMGVFIGGMLAGPIGMAIGGSVTSLAVAVNSQGTFKPVVVIINEMTDHQKRKLGEAVLKVLQNVEIEDCALLLKAALCSGSLKEAVISELGLFLMKEFRMQITR